MSSITKITILGEVGTDSARIKRSKTEKIVPILIQGMRSCFFQRSRIKLFYIILNSWIKLLVHSSLI